MLWKPGSLVELRAGSPRRVCPAGGIPGTDPGGEETWKPTETRATTAGRRTTTASPLETGTRPLTLQTVRCPPFPRGGGLVVSEHEALTCEMACWRVNVDTTPTSPRSTGITTRGSPTHTAATVTATARAGGRPGGDCFLPRPQVGFHPTPHPHPVGGS